MVALRSSECPLIGARESQWQMKKPGVGGIRWIAFSSSVEFVSTALRKAAADPPEGLFLFIRFGSVNLVKGIKSGVA